MAKVTLPRLASGFLSTELINTALEQIEVAFDNTLSRDGDGPNQMESDIDMNGRVLLNGGISDDPNRVVTFSELVAYTSGLSSGFVVQKQEIQTSGNLQTVFNLTTLEYTPGANNIAVYVNGVRKFVPIDFTETDADTITFLAGQTIGAKVEFVVNEYLGTSAVQSHTHPWSQITNTPDFTTRWPTWTEVTSKPVTFPPDIHAHAAGDITSGRMADARRGVWVQAAQPTANTVGELWFW